MGDVRWNSQSAQKIAALLSNLSGELVTLKDQVRMASKVDMPQRYDDAFANISRRLLVLSERASSLSQGVRRADIRMQDVEDALLRDAQVLIKGITMLPHVTPHSPVIPIPPIIFNPPPFIPPPLIDKPPFIPRGYLHDYLRERTNPLPPPTVIWWRKHVLAVTALDNFNRDLLNTFGGITIPPFSEGIERVVLPVPHSELSSATSFMPE